MNFSAGRAHGRAEVYIDRGDSEENMHIFNWLLERRAQIESDFGGELVWEPLEDKRACRIKAEIDGNIFQKEQWLNMIEYMTDAMIRMERAFKEPLTRLNGELKSR